MAKELRYRPRRQTCHIQRRRHRFSERVKLDPSEAEALTVRPPVSFRVPGVPHIPQRGWKDERPFCAPPQQQTEELIGCAEIDLLPAERESLADATTRERQENKKIGEVQRLQSCVRQHYSLEVADLIERQRRRASGSRPLVASGAS